MTADLLTLLPNLSIGVVAVLSLAYISIQHAKTQRDTQERFIKTLDDRADKHEAAMGKREDAMRSLETSVRSSMTEQLTKNTVALFDVAKVLGRVVRHLDGDGHDH